jgi:type I restriction enzyme R subunit
MKARRSRISLKDHTREIIKNHYASLDDFLNKWNHTDKKAAIVKEMEEQGVLVSALQEAVNKELDLFDLVCHRSLRSATINKKGKSQQCQEAELLYKIW